MISYKYFANNKFFEDDYEWEIFIVYYSDKKMFWYDGTLDEQDRLGIAKITKDDIFLKHLNIKYD